MIHQHIFAGPKPGMSAKEFQDYWVNVHAVQYAGRIPQFRRYVVDTRIPFDEDMGDPTFPYQGVAEIWFLNDDEALACAQSKEYLDGARIDEPRWAAYWLTFALDTTAHVIVEGPPLSREPTSVKWLVLLKRKPGLSVADFRGYSLETHAPIACNLPGVRRYQQCHVRDSSYFFGETRFDCVSQIWFDDMRAFTAMTASAEFQEQFKSDLQAFTDSKYVFSLATEEHWIIGPEYR